MRAGDRIEAVVGAPTPTISLVKARISADGGKPITLQLGRDGHGLSLPVNVGVEPGSHRGVIGVLTFELIPIGPLRPINALLEAARPAAG